MINTENLNDIRIEQLAIGYILGTHDVQNMGIEEYVACVFKVKPEIEKFLKGNNLSK